MSLNNSSSSSGGSFFGILGIIFIVLKLVGVISWSWWWVLCPIYAPYLIAFIVLGIIYIHEQHSYKRFKERMRKKVDEEKRS